MVNAVGSIVTEALAVFEPSVTCTVTAPGVPSAEKRPVTELMLPTIPILENVYPPVPPLAVNCCVPFTFTCVDVGLIESGGGSIVTDASDWAEAESVTRTIALPEVPGAV
jgi:hypothetical protein